MPFENKFRSLTPNDAMDLQHYRDALDHVFSSGKIRNIALTGSYGSGKSSVIRSYENIHKEKAFIHISLARFEEQGQFANHPADSTKIVNILEGKIINQLLHQIPEKNLPPAYIQPQGRIPWSRHLLMVLGILAFAVSWIYVFQFQRWVLAVSGLGESWVKPLLQATTNPYGRLTGVGLLLILLGCGMFYVLRTYPFRVWFKKVDLKGLVGIELFNAEEDTYFDKYLHNVLQLFDQADADAIVFEDLDRYDVTLIFEKLREISDLACSREKLGLRQGKKPLRFFYLIRDDVFTASDRSKFFDFIIPVVPYVDATNSCDQLLQRFEEAGFAGLFSKRFLQDVSLYLSDMRLVSNIVNEYIVYHGRLSSSGLATKPDRQLAMVIYKNLYPEDFDLLQKGQGYVYALFERKKRLIRTEKKRLNDRIQTLRRRLDDAREETLKSMDELNALYFPLSESGITVGGTNVSNLSRTELVRRILENPNAVKYTDYKKNGFYDYYEKSSKPLNVEEKLAELEANEDYIRHKVHIEVQSSQSQKKITEEIRDLQERQAELGSMNLREILSGLEPNEETAFWSPQLPTYEPADYLKTIQNNKNFGLLKYLVRNGYIDENYAAYISYFYPNSLTAQDRNFLLSITDRAPLAYDYHLNRPDAVLERLEEADFSRREVRNFDLLSYLLRLKGPNLRTLLQSGIKDQSAHGFFAAFWRTGRRSTRAFRLIRVLCREHPEWFRTWCENASVLWEGEWRLFILDALYFLPPSRLRRINGEKWLTEKLSADPEFLQLDSPNIRRLISAFKTLNVRFSQINYREEDIPLVREVCLENLYVLNLSMIKTAMAVFWKVPPAEAGGRSYTHVLLHPDEPLSLRVLENMDVYASAILHENDVRFSDSEEAVIALLNCETLSESYKEEYIQRSDTVLRDINSITSRTLWPALIRNQAIADTWQNMADYFAEWNQDSAVLPPELAAFINNGSGSLGWKYAQLNQRIGDQANKLRQAVLINEELSLKRYRTALAGMTFSYQKFPFHEIPEDRMKIVLDLGIVPVNVMNAAVIREYYPRLWSDFILPNGVEKLMNLMGAGELQLSEPELAGLLEDSRLTGSAAEKLLSLFSEPVSLQDRTFPDLVRTRIVEAHLDPGDLPFLLKSFARESPAVRSVFLDYARTHADSIAGAAEQARFIPVEVYAACLNVLTEESLLTLRPYLPDNNFEIVCTENKKPKFPDTPEVRAILAAFESYRWISSWKSKGGKIITYPTRK